VYIKYSIRSEKLPFGFLFHIFSTFIPFESLCADKPTTTQMLTLVMGGVQINSEW